jgi:hypothetical protein
VAATLWGVLNGIEGNAVSRVLWGIHDKDLSRGKTLLPALPGRI